MKKEQKSRFGSVSYVSDTLWISLIFLLVLIILAIIKFKKPIIISAFGKRIFKV